MDDLQRLRLEVASRRRAEINELAGVGDGATTKFKVQMVPVFSDTLEVVARDAGVATPVPPEDYTADLDTGVLTFVEAPDLNVEVLCSYEWSAFSDEELQEVLTETGSVLAAALRVIDWILTDQDRFMKYTLGQESVDRTASISALKARRSALVARLSSSAVSIVCADTAERRADMSPFLEGNCGR